MFGKFANKTILKAMIPATFKSYAFVELQLLRTFTLPKITTIIIFFKTELRHIREWHRFLYVFHYNILSQSTSEVNTAHKRRSNVFGDAKVWFCPNLITFAKNLFLILPKSNQINPNLTNFAPKKFAREYGCIPSSYDTDTALNYKWIKTVSAK